MSIDNYDTVDKDSLITNLSTLRKIHRKWNFVIKSPNSISKWCQTNTQKDWILDTLANYSLHTKVYRIMACNESKSMMIYLEESKDGTTNIDIDVMNLIEKMSG